MSHGARDRFAGSWPLWSILAAQAALSVPWLWRTAPVSDEALYIDVGHQEWAHLLHHAALGSYPRFFSGAPVLYPPLAAAADSTGGLAAARGLSLGFMILTTALIYLTGRRLFGHLAGILGSLLFAVCGLGVHYGALATFDPLALTLLMLAAWTAARSRTGGGGRLAVCALSLAAANATKYGTLAWDPVIAGIVILDGWSTGRWRAVGLAASVAATVLVLDLGLLMLGGADYATGFVVTTVFRSIRSGPPTSPAVVLLHAVAVTGLIVLTAVVGMVVSLVKKMPVAQTALIGLLIAAALLAPIEQARIHQLSSLDRNMGYGLAFACLGAGYGLNAGRTWLAGWRTWGRLAATGAAVVLILAVLVAGRMQKVQFRGPALATAGQIVTAIKRAYQPGTFVLSDGGARMEQYYLPSIPGDSWLPSFVPSTVQGEQIQARICSGSVSVVVLRLRGRRYNHPFDHTIIQALRRTNVFGLAVIAGTGLDKTEVWKLEGPSQSVGGCR